MPADWDQAFDFYMPWDDGVPLLVSLDVNAKDRIPLASHPRFLTLRVTMQNPREDGLRSEEESDALFDLQDVLETRLGAEFDAIYWGKVVGGGFTFFDYHLPEVEEARIRQVVSSLETPYAIGGQNEHDPEWQRYLSLYPGAYFLQTMWNRQIQARAGGAGRRSGHAASRRSHCSFPHTRRGQIGHPCAEEGAVQGRSGGRSGRERALPASLPPH